MTGKEQVTGGAAGNLSCVGYAVCTDKKRYFAYATAKKRIIIYDLLNVLHSLLNKMVPGPLYVELPNDSVPHSVTMILNGDMWVIDKKGNIYQLEGYQAQLQQVQNSEPELQQSQVHCRLVFKDTQEQVSDYLGLRNSQSESWNIIPSVMRAVFVPCSKNFVADTTYSKKAKSDPKSRENKSPRHTQNASHNCWLHSTAPTLQKTTKQSTCCFRTDTEPNGKPNRS